MADRLLDKQTSLLEYLTSGAGIFGDPREDPACHRTPFGIERGLLHLEARYSHEKRMAKIEWVLPRTLELLGSDRARICRDFVEACPPTNIGRIENAQQFHDFLSARGRNQSPGPPYLPDVASFELACATLRSGEIGEDHASQAAATAPPGAVRRSRRAAFLRCAYDIGPLLEGRLDAAPLEPCETRLAIAMVRGSAEPVVCALSAELVAILEMLDQFVDPAIFDDTPGANELIIHLTASGLLEVGP
jgi:hypothetical protein